MNIKRVMNSCTQKNITSATNSISFSSGIAADKFIKSSIRHFGMNSDELNKFLAEFRTSFEKSFNNLVAEFLPAEIEEELNKALTKIRKIKYVRTHFPETNARELFAGVLKKETAYIKDVESFGKWFSESDYNNYRKKIFNIIEQKRKKAVTNLDVESYRMRAAELKELIETYNEAGTTGEILEEFLDDEIIQQDLYKILANLPDGEFEEMFDVVFPSFASLSKNRVALCSYIKSKISLKAADDQLTKMPNLFGMLNFDTFLKKFQIKKIKKTDFQTFEQLCKVSRVSSRELDDLRMSLGSDLSETSLRNTLQLKFYLSKISEFYKKQIGLKDVYDIYQNGILKDDSDFILKVLRKILPDESEITTRNIAKHLIENKKAIFDNSTIKKKFYGELQASDLSNDALKLVRKINPNDKKDLMSTGFFTNKIVDFMKKEGLQLDISDSFLNYVIKNNIPYSSLTNLQLHKICDELAEQYSLSKKTDGYFADAIDGFFAQKDIAIQSMEILLCFDKLSKNIDTYMENLRLNDIDVSFLKTFDSAEENDEILTRINKYVRTKMQTGLQKESVKRPKVVFSKHAILRLIGRDLIEPYDITGENLEFNSFLTKLYFAAADNKGKNFKMPELNGYSGLSVKTSVKDNVITITTLY